MSFPSSPTVGQQHAEGGRLYQWTSYSTWDLVANVAGHAATHAANGSDPLTLSAGQVSGLANVATSGSATDLTAGTLADARLSANVVLASALSTNLGQASSTLDAINRVDTAANVAAVSGQVLLAFFTPLQTLTVSQITVAVGGGTAASGLTLARMGIYTYQTDGGTATLVARTASDTTLFTAQNTAYTRSLDTTGGFPATYTLTAGVRYGVGYICVGTTQPQVVGRAITASVASLSPRLSGASGTQSDLPSSFTPSTNGQAPYARLS